jgi:hypothetical protein
VLDAVDELAHRWDVPAAPVLVDAQLEPNVEPLLHGLEERGLRYLVRVGDRTPALPATSERSAERRRVPTVGELAAEAAKQGRMILNWRDTVNGTTTTSRFSATVVPGGPLPGVPIRIGPRHTYRPARGVLAEWSAGGKQATSLWLNNLGNVRLPELIRLAKLRSRASSETERLRDEFGLHCFEGRSFRGWHHHMTLVSAAHVYRTLQRLETDRFDDAKQLRPWA